MGDHLYIPQVFLACPRYGHVEWESAASVMRASELCDVTVRPSMSSVLCDNFNRLWAEALNLRASRPLTHFAMIHSDISAESGWLDTLMLELQRANLDVISVIVPLKDERGLTSTGILKQATNRIHQFTLADVYNLPVTFTLNDINHLEDEVLAINTGLWVCTFTQPWIEKIVFRTYTDIIKDEENSFHAVSLTEDWDFSLQCARLDVKVGATRIVRVGHYGRKEYSNDTVWGV